MTFGPINTLPIGFPNLFGMTGQSLPKGFEENIQPVLDMLPFFTAANAQEVFAFNAVNVNAPASYAFTNSIVPATEAWLVLGATSTAATLAGESIRYTLMACRGDPGSPNWTPFLNLGQGTSSLTGAAGVSSVRIVSPGPPFLLYGGDSVCIHADNVTTAGNIAVNARVMIFRFTI